MAPIRRLGVIANLTRPRAREGLEAFSRAAAGAGMAVFAEPATAEALPGAETLRLEAFPEAGVQAVASLGGDGSLLAAAHALAEAGVDLPLIGLNVGRLGYLTAVNEEGFAGTLAHLAAGRFEEEPRTALEARVHRADGSVAALPNALNDVVLSRAEGGHAFALELDLDGHPVAHADGVDGLFALGGRAGDGAGRAGVGHQRHRAARAERAPAGRARHRAGDRARERGGWGPGHGVCRRPGGGADGAGRRVARGGRGAAGPPADALAPQPLRAALEEIGVGGAVRAVGRAQGGKGCAIMEGNQEFQHNV